jgi:hypothetical protein
MDGCRKGWEPSRPDGGQNQEAADAFGGLFAIVMYRVPDFGRATPAGATPPDRGAGGNNAITITSRSLATMPPPRRSRPVPRALPAAGESPVPLSQAGDGVFPGDRARWISAVRGDPSLHLAGLGARSAARARGPMRCDALPDLPHQADTLFDRQAQDLIHYGCDHGFNFRSYRPGIKPRSRRPAPPGHSTRLTTPCPPFTRTRSPSLSAVRAPWTAITAGTPTSRAVTAPCESGPPLSVTTATAE